MGVGTRVNIYRTLIACSARSLVNDKVVLLDVLTQSSTQAIRCFNSVKELTRMRNFDNFSIGICDCNCVHRCPGRMKQAMEKYIDVLQRGNYTAKTDEFQRKASAYLHMRKQSPSFTSTSQRRGMKNWYL